MTMRRRPSHVRSITIGVSAAALISSALIGEAALTATATVQSATSWTVYHANAAGTGVSSELKSVDTATARVDFSGAER